MSTRARPARPNTAGAMAADQRLERILYILPMAGRRDGATLDELARALDVAPGVILADLEHVTAREFYMPAGSVDAFRFTISGERVRFDAGSNFRRPVRLNGREALALGLGLRVLASEAPVEEQAEILRLARRLERMLVAPEFRPAIDAGEEPPRLSPSALPHADIAEGRAARYDMAEDSVEYEPADDREVFVDLGDDTARGVLAAAIEERRRCTIEYLKPGDRAPATRRIDPYVLVYGDGNWYVVAHDTGVGARRVFRLDRILGARLEDETFAVADDFDAAALLARAPAPFLAEADVEITVRYSPAIAPWIAERSGAEPEPDGSVLLRHRVADPRWLTRHIMQYGGDAWIEGGEKADEYRRLVAESAARLAG